MFEKRNCNNDPISSFKFRAVIDRKFCIYILKGISMIYINIQSCVSSQTRSVTETIRTPLYIYHINYSHDV